MFLFLLLMQKLVPVPMSVFSNDVGSQYQLVCKLMFQKAAFMPLWTLFGPLFPRREMGAHGYIVECTPKTFIGYLEPVIRCFKMAAN